MPLNPILLKQDIKDIFTSAFDDSANSTPEEAMDKVAEALANRITDEIKNLTLTIQPGLVIVATGAGPASNVSPIVVTNGVT